MVYVNEFQHIPFLISKLALSHLPDSTLNTLITLAETNCNSIIRYILCYN